MKTKFANFVSAEIETFYILTLAALAEELKFRGLHEADVPLAVGFPLAWMKSQGADFKRYLMKEQERLKEQDQLFWVRRMNNIWTRAEEIVREEIIFNL